MSGADFLPGAVRIFGRGFRATLGEVHDDTVGSLPPPAPPIAPGGLPARIGAFVPVRLLGRGSIATTYAARAPDRTEEIAVKVVRAARLAAEPELRARAVTALRALVAVAHHANVAAVYDAGEIDGAIYVAMERVTGTTLASWLAAARRPAREIVRVFVAAGRGLAAAHAAGVVHHDVKPENVLVDASGRPVVVDFAIACATPGERGELANLAVDDPRARTGSLAGTPRSYAPEQLRGEVDARSDQFAFAVALSEALTGQHPFAGDTLGALWRALASGQRRARRGAAAARVPAGVERALDRALQVAPSARYPRIDDLLADLDAAIAAPPRARRRRAAVAVAIAASLAAAIAVAAIAAGTRAGGAAGGDGGVGRAVADAAAARPADTRPLLVLIQPFDNATGDARLDDTPAIAMADEVAWSHHLVDYAGADLEILATVAHADARHAGIVANWLRFDETRRVALVLGNIQRDGDGFILEIDATAQGLPELHEVARATGTGTVLAAAAELGARLRVWGGDRDAATPHPPLTASLDAMHALSAADAEGVHVDDAVAQARRALAYDPDYPSARVTLGRALVGTRHRVEAADELARANAGPRALPDRRRMMTAADRDAALGEYRDALAIHREVLALWPHEVRVQIVATDLANAGLLWSDAVELARAAYAEHPWFSELAMNLLAAELGANHFTEAKLAADDLMNFDHATTQPEPAGVATAAVAYELAGAKPDAAIELLGREGDPRETLVVADISYYRGDSRGRRGGAVVGGRRRDGQARGGDDPGAAADARAPACDARRSRRRARARARAAREPDDRSRRLPRGEHDDRRGRGRGLGRRD